MNQGNLQGFTVIRGIPPGSSYPEMKVLYIPISFSENVIHAGSIDTLFLVDTPSARTYTIEPYVQVKEGQCMHFAQWGTEALTIAAGSGVILRCAGTPSTRAQFSVITIMFTQRPNVEWLLFGDFAA